MAQLSIKLLPSQIKVKNSEAREILYSGGFGSGKSSIGCYMALRQATIPNNRVLILRKTFSSLKKSTMNSMISGKNPILPHGSYVLNKSEGIIKLNNGGEIYFMGCDDPDRIKSTEFGCIFIDEASELTEEEYNVIKYRCRLDVGSRQIYLCTNPASHSHWLYKRFYQEDNRNREAITASSIENKYLPTDYIEELKTMDGQQYKRCVEGQWINLEKAIFDTFDRTIHVRHLPTKAKFEEYIIGVDYGYTNFTAMIVLGKNGDRLTVVDEFYKNKMLLRDIVEQIVSCDKQYNAPTFVYDPSAAALGAELENINVHAIKANNDVASGIDRIRNKLRIRNDMPDLVISDTCSNAIREIENYQYQNGTEKPIKINDHLCFIKGTQILTNKGYKNIEDIKINDSVYTGNLYNKVSDSNSTGNREVGLYSLNGKLLICTEDHPVFINDTKIGIGELCKLFNINHKRELLKRLSLKEGHTEDIYITVATNTLHVDRIESIKDLDAYTEIYGKSTMDQYLKDLMCTIKISVTRTMIYLISNWLKKKNICQYTVRNTIKTIQTSLLNKLIGTKINVENGINQMKGWIGIKQKEAKSLEIDQKLLLNVLNVEKKQNMIISEQEINIGNNSAPTIVSQLGEGSLVKIILALYAQYVKLLSQKINIQKSSIAQESVRERLENVSYVNLNTQEVFNITVEDTHRYFANGILVSNCDGLRYAISFIDDQKGQFIYPTFVNDSKEPHNDEDMWEEVNQNVGIT